MTARSTSSGPIPSAATASGSVEGGRQQPKRTIIDGVDQAPASVYDVALLDLDGVVYLGHDPVPNASDALARAREQGMRLAFVTNNASRRPEEVAELLDDVGVPASVEDIVTSAQAAAHLLADKLDPGAAVLIVGTDALASIVDAAGLRAVRSAEDQPLAVVQGFGQNVDWGQLAEAAVAIRRGAWFVATNTDLTVPSTRGRLPGNGVLVQALASATDVEPFVVGKPELTLHAEAMQRSGARRPLVVGDRLDTDIEGAVRGGADSLLVLTGVTDAVQLLRAPAHQRPTLVADDLLGLLGPHPAVHRTQDAVSCRNVRVTRTGHSIEATIQGESDAAAESGTDARIDLLRALCVLHWSDSQDSDEIPHVRGTGAAARSAAEQLGLGGE